MKRLIIITSTISLILIFTGLFFKNLAIDFEVFNLILDFNITGDQLTGTGVIGLTTLLPNPLIFNLSKLFINL